MNEIQNKIQSVLHSIGGNILFDGAFRFLSIEESSQLLDFYSSQYSDIVGNYVPFAIDWVARLYCQSLTDASHLIMLDPGFNERLGLNATLEDFIQILLPQQGEELVAKNTYDKWRIKNSDPLAKNECAGYIILPVLGGVDDETNLERTDLFVYVSMCAQIQG